jgi:hypothetical protein
MASPSGSRTIGQPTTATGNDGHRPCAGRWPAAGSPSRRSRPGRADDVEQLAHHSRHPEVRRPGRASMVAARSGRSPRSPQAAGTSPDRQGEQQVDPDRLRPGRVGRQVAGIGAEVLPAPNYSGFTKIDATTTSHSALARANDSCPSMQVPHRRHEPTVAPSRRAASSVPRLGDGRRHPSAHPASPGPPPSPRPTPEPVPHRRPIR